MRIGIDVGGTHTDAVLMNGNDILATIKTLTTTDVVSGILSALNSLLQDSGAGDEQIEAIMIGTTQFTNAVVERRELAQVAAVRVGLPSGQGLPPMVDWPEDLSAILGQHSYMLKGGYLYDNWPIAELDESEVAHLVQDLLAKKLTNIAISSVFSSMNPEPEILVANKILEAIPDANITMSHQIGRIGLLERENAAILNTALLPFAKRVVAAFELAIKTRGIHCPVFVSQNDGTLMNVAFVEQFPALTFASGPTNSLRGASKLTGIKDAIVVDIGGTTSDIGVLQNGFPRESSAIVDVGGVRTNFRMPDIKALGLGGGSVVSEEGRVIGPHSVGHKLVSEALVFGGDTLTATDLVVAAGEADVGDKQAVSHLSNTLIEQGKATMQAFLDQGIDMMKLNDKPLPVILVGGGALLVSGELSSASEVIRPEHAGVANAIGASIAQISGESESIVSYQNTTREQAIAEVTKQASDNALKAGADFDSITVVEIEESVVPYLDGASTKVRIKVMGDVALLTRQSKTA